MNLNNTLNDVSKCRNHLFLLLVFIFTTKQNCCYSTRQMFQAFLAKISTQKNHRDEIELEIGMIYRPQGPLLFMFLSFFDVFRDGRLWGPRWSRPELVIVLEHISNSNQQKPQKILPHSNQIIIKTTRIFSYTTTQSQSSQQIRKIRFQHILFHNQRQQQIFLLLLR